LTKPDGSIRVFGPNEPCIDAPGGPCGPADPLTPGGPTGPDAPRGPGAPGGPGGPGGPDCLTSLSLDPKFSGFEVEFLLFC